MAEDIALRLPAALHVQRIQKCIPDCNISRIETAFAVAQRLYGDSRHESLNICLIDHVRGSLDLVLQYCPDEDSVIACLLQHILKESRMSLHELEEQFGPDVKELVSGIHLLSYVTTDDRRRSIDDLKIMLVSVSRDVRVVLLKLSIRCYTLMIADTLPEHLRVRYCREALQLYAPVAARLGIYAIKQFMEDKAFCVVYPVECENISTQLKMLHEASGKFIDNAVASLHAFLKKEGIDATVIGREKHPYSIFVKQRSHSITGIDQIHDLFALRVIVQKDTDCYQALGLIHKLGTPLSHRFKDYISFPKPNGYQSLHTCVLRLPGMPKDVKIEIQIRTEAMNHEAEFGIAAHWQYKEKGSAARAADMVQLQRLLERPQIVDDNEAHADPMPFTDQIYVLTPHGDIIELPDGATPLDFAFMIHTDLGLSFKSAKVNGAIVALSHKLENGDVVDIQSHKHPKPSHHWIEHVRTSSARNKLKSYFASQERGDLIERGREILNAELHARGIPLLDTELSLLKIFDGSTLTPHEREDILMKLGQGSIRASSLFKHIADRVAPRKVRVQKERVSRSQHIVEIEGGVAMPLRFAKCCNAANAEFAHPEIIGFITRTGEVSVHRKACGMLKNANPERRITVRWRRA